MPKLQKKTSYYQLGRNQENDPLDLLKINLRLSQMSTEEILSNITNDSERIKRHIGRNQENDPFLLAQLMYLRELLNPERKKEFEKLLFGEKGNIITKHFNTLFNEQSGILTILVESNPHIIQSQLQKSRLVEPYANKKIHLRDRLQPIKASILPTIKDLRKRGEEIDDERIRVQQEKRKIEEAEWAQYRESQKLREKADAERVAKEQAAAKAEEKANIETKLEAKSNVNAETKAEEKKQFEAKLEAKTKDIKADEKANIDEKKEAQNQVNVEAKQGEAKEAKETKADEKKLQLASAEPPSVASAEPPSVASAEPPSVASAEPPSGNESVSPIRPGGRR